jgi:hypothetical protein
MARITIDFPDGVQSRIVDAFASVYGWSATIPGPTEGSDPIPNPISRAQFVKYRVLHFIRGTVRAHEAQQAQETARRAAEDAVDQEITLT